VWATAPARPRRSYDRVLSAALVGAGPSGGALAGFGLRAVDIDASMTAAMHDRRRHRRQGRPGRRQSVTRLRFHNGGHRSPPAVHFSDAIPRGATTLVGGLGRHLAAGRSPRATRTVGNLTLTSAVDRARPAFVVNPLRPRSRVTIRPTAAAHHQGSARTSGDGSTGPTSTTTNIVHHQQTAARVLLHGRRHTFRL